MKNTSLQLTIREITQQIQSPKFWAGLIGVVCILAVSAPFDTAEQFNNIQRFFYWLGISVSTYFLAIFVLLMVFGQLEKLGKSELSARVVASLMAAVSVALLVFFINAVVLGIDELRWKTLVTLGGNCILISLAVTSIFFIAHDSLQKTSGTAANSQSPAPLVPTTSPFYQRLPGSLGTDLISLQAQDHYVEVKTTLGSELILIRLSDAIKELEAVNGLQVHRSWWVTHKHIVEQKRLQNKLHLILSDGTAVPVSRTYSAGVKAALSAA